MNTDMLDHHDRPHHGHVVSVIVRTSRR